MQPTSSPVRVCLLLCGATLVALGQWVGQAMPLELRAASAWPTVIGLAFLMLAALAIYRGETATRPERWLARLGVRLTVQDWQVILLLTSPILALIAALAAGDNAKMISPFLASVSWVAAIGAAIVGGFSSQGGRIAWPRPEAYLLVGLTLLAFLARGLATDRVPIFLTGDEGSAGIAASEFVKGEWNNPFIVSWYSFPSLFFFLQSLSVRILGHTTEALRIPSALVGALTVAAVYVLGRAMFGRRAGLVAAIFLLGYNFHIHFSRIGLNNIWDGLWYVVVLGTLWYGWQNNQRLAYLVSGVSLGLAQYFYPTARALPVLMLTWVVLSGLFDRQRLKQALPNLALMLLTTAVVLLPLASFYSRHPLDYMAPFERVSALGPWLEFEVETSGQPAWLILLKQMATSFLAFTYVPLRFWYESGAPLLRPLPASLFLLGLVMLAARGRDHRFLLLGLWVAMFGVIGGLSESTPASQRYIAVAPACALIIGFGLNEVASLLEMQWPSRRRAVGLLAVALAVIIAADEIYFYFAKYTVNSTITQDHSHGVIAQRLANSLKSMPSDTHVAFFGFPAMGFYSIPSVQYLVPNIDGVDMAEPWGSTQNPPVEGDHLVFVFLPFLQEQIALVQEDYPGGRLSNEVGYDGKPLYWAYEVEAGRVGGSE
jgi:4-amino-4-deoxy-L-arabinose transferase-like glycosyltransferase